MLGASLGFPFPVVAGLGLVASVGMANVVPIGVVDEIGGPAKSLEDAWKTHSSLGVTQHVARSESLSAEINERGGLAKNLEDAGKSHSWHSVSQPTTRSESSTSSLYPATAAGSELQNEGLCSTTEGDLYPCKKWHPLKRTEVVEMSKDGISIDANGHIFLCARKRGDSEDVEEREVPHWAFMQHSFLWVLLLGRYFGGFLERQKSRVMVSLDFLGVFGVDGRY
jgi:hypothetical protein